MQTIYIYTSAQIGSKAEVRGHAGQGYGEWFHDERDYHHGCWELPRPSPLWVTISKHVLIVSEIDAKLYDVH